MDYLGHVNVQILDKKSSSCTTGQYAYLSANISSLTDYYPFGMPMPGRNLSISHYRMGFNGYEKDDEISGKGNSIDFTARMYDSRLARFKSLDPYAIKFPSESNYSFAGNSPIFFVDKDGKFKISAANESEYWQRYPLIMKYLSTQIESDVLNSSKIKNGLKEINPHIIDRTIKAMVTWEQGPEIIFKEKPGELPLPGEFKEAAGYLSAGTRQIQLNSRYADYLEGVLSSDATEDVKLVTLMRFYMTLIHETGHELNKYGPARYDKNGDLKHETLGFGGYSTDEQGYKVEEYIWGTDFFKPFTDPPTEAPGIKGIKSHKYQQGVTEGIIKEAKKTEEGRKSLPTIPRK